MASRGVRASVVRLPQVHDRVKQGLVTYLIAVAREKGVSAFVGDGLNRWPAVHLLDAAHLYRLALEKGSAGARYHAVAEEGVPLREIADAIGRGLNVPVVAKSPEEAADHFGWLGFFVGIDCSGFKRANAGTAGMAPDAAWADFRPRPARLIRTLESLRSGAAATDGVIHTWLSAVGSAPASPPTARQARGKPYGRPQARFRATMAAGL